MKLGNETVSTFAKSRDSIDQRRTRESPASSTSRAAELQPSMSGTSRALGAIALGAIAMGALAIGALAIGRLAISRARIRRLEIDELNVRHLRVTETFQSPATPDQHS